jgi:hypothetical protein
MVDFLGLRIKNYSAWGMVDFLDWEFETVPFGE